MGFDWLNSQEPDLQKIRRALLRTTGKLYSIHEIKQMLHDGAHSKTATTTEITFEEKISGKSYDQIVTERQRKLEAEWTRRRKETASRVR